MEQNYKGKQVEHSFRGIAKVVEDEEHIINYAYQFRIGRISGIDEEQNFIRRLKNFLIELKQAIN
jgi:hypothetical protein